MLSRLAINTARFAPAFRADLSIIPRCSSTAVTIPKVTDVADATHYVPSTMTKSLEHWEKANALFYGPERDYENFPTQSQVEFNPPVRVGFIPESMFKAFYEKTGVTGPYILLGGVGATLLSKELWVLDHYFGTALGFMADVLFIVWWFGPRIRAWLIKEQDEYIDRQWHAPIAAVKANSLLDIEALEKQNWREEGQKYLFEAKKENVDIQLEEEYRRRLSEVHHAVKNRLDYQLELDNTKIRFEQTHMVNWIVDSVLKGITPQQEKDSINKCISDLKGLSQKAQMA